MERPKGYTFRSYGPFVPMEPRSSGVRTHHTGMFTFMVTTIVADDGVVIVLHESWER